MGLLRDLGEGAKTFGGNPPRNATTANLRRLVNKLWRCSKYQINQIKSKSEFT